VASGKFQIGNGGVIAHIVCSSNHNLPLAPPTRLAGLGTFLTQAPKAQKQVELVQQQLAARELEVSAGGGAVRVKANGAGEFLALTLDPEFLKEDAAVVAQTILDAVKQTAAQAKALGEEEMNKVTAQFQMPGLF
jgi:DNA-binding YbaB/EbfC family protein